VAGIDLASTEDLASLALIFPGDDERIDVLSFSWCPEAKVQKRARMKVPYDQWAREGYLIATSGDMIDYSAIHAKFDELAGEYDIREAGVDPASNGKTFARELCDRYGETFAHTVAQTFDNLSGPFKDILRLLKMRKVRHGGSPVLRWCAGNLAAHFRGKIPQGADLADHLDKVPIIPSKQASADKIDPFAALVIAHARLKESPITADDGPTVMVL
jgi:phage terminase large subunit-like protein